jgi:hypothetical protein
MHLPGKCQYIARGFFSPSSAARAYLYGDGYAQQCGLAAAGTDQE